ncbi:hypothetical protein PRUB_a5199 [Pseudoalteromonas rubra]|uniref:Uncharacterized protein n=1 Tax=Pseudoalteromonas rubra TaxID=43658 RepID=A0A8T0CAC1_9GAMM|nr:hypothetical protein PRUB_a5199 [Pseudoalteromonas rubra]
MLSTLFSRLKIDHLIKQIGINLRTHSCCAIKTVFYRESGLGISGECNNLRNGMS